MKNSTSIQTSWSKLAGADTYRVYIATSANGTYKLTSTVAKNACVITGLTKGKTYFVKVAACAGDTVGNLSEARSVEL